MNSEHKGKPITQKTTANAKRAAKAAKQAEDIEASTIAMSPQNRQHFAAVKAAIAAAKTASPAVVVKLSKEREQQLTEWKQVAARQDAVMRDWGQRLSSTRQGVINLNQRYRDLLYNYLQEAYEVYREIEQHELADSFYAHLRGEFRTNGEKIQSNTPNAGLIVRFIFGTAASTKSVSEYSKVMKAALARDVESASFADWLKCETLTKVITDQRAIEKEAETPTDRLERARRLVLKLMDIRDAVPIFTHDTTAHNAEGLLGRSYGLCIALGHASRKMDRQSFYAEMRFSLVFPVSIDFEILIVDKLARYLMAGLTQYEQQLEELTETVWAEHIFEVIVAACDAEVENNKKVWANRQQNAQGAHQ